MTSYDAVVVGAGPAGARTARDLARRGLKTVLLEEHSQVGLPCHCSGLVTGRTLAEAGVGPELVLNSISGATVRLPSDQELKLNAGRVRAYVIDRVELDRRLVEQATFAGAELRLGEKFSSFSSSGGTSLSDGSVEVQVRGSMGDFTIRARLLIGADGAMSRVAAQVRGAGRNGFIRAFAGTAAYQANSWTDRVEIFFDEHAAPGWFAWTIPLDSSASRIGIGSANGLKPIEGFTRMRRSFPESFGSASLTCRTAGMIPLWAPGPCVADRVMLVGDAARQVKPTSGGGIYTALASAGIAAEVAGNAFRKGDFSSQSLSAYPREWKKKMGWELQRQHDMRRVLNGLDADNLARVIKMLSAPRVKSRVELLGDIDFSSSTTWALLRRPGLLVRLVRFPEFPLAWLQGRQKTP